MATTGIQALITEGLFKALAVQAYTGKDKTGTPVALPYAWPEQAFDPSTVSRYLRVDIAFNNHGFQTLNDEKVERMGFLIVNVVYPKLTGIITPTEVAAAIELAWKKGTTIIYNSIKIKVMPAPYQGSPLSDATRVSLPVNIPWKAYTN